ncbi:2-iminoacetate synthase ThiH [Bacillus sp. OTU530]|uniref:2-iminoacetate synthase ThiH n=1 Tax=Bacillus sp. OTU530 TaxID=3043862 RepID=UPI00313AB7CD
MSFYEKYSEVKHTSFETLFSTISHEDVQHAIHKPTLNEFDFLTLLSPAAEAFVEEMSQKAQQVTRKYFGHVMQLFAPLYISDYCVNRCEYCGFSVNHDFPRRRLTLLEIEEEGKAIAKMGIQNLLLVTGESRQHVSIPYLKECVSVLKKYFSTIAIEVQPLKTEEYQDLVEFGVDGLTVHQETYNEEIYKQLHVKGPKRNYAYRLDTPERGCCAGMRTVYIGALLGLDDWRKEAFFTGLHAQYLQQMYSKTEIGIAFPRMRPHLGEFQPAMDVTDQNLVQIILATRLFLPKAGMTLSTRERPAFREKLIHFGITKMSAASSTAVGGYANKQESHSQFEISDERSVDEVVTMLKKYGYVPICREATAL